jgi:chromosome partitioning protein
LSDYSFTFLLGHLLKMKVVAVLNEKGGCGKTTIATNLARGLQLEGRDVMLVDSDVQGSARDWGAVDTETKKPAVVGMDRPTLHKDIPKVAEGSDVVVIDGAARAEKMQTSAIKASDLVLIPVQPSAYDIWSSETLVELVRARQEVAGKPDAAFIVSRQIVGTNLAGEAQEALESFDLPVLRGRTAQRVIYAEAASQGLSVLDVDPSSKAAGEIRQIVEDILATLDLQTARTNGTAG